MTTVADPATDHPIDATTVDVEIVVPVFNEETDLEPSIRRLDAFRLQTGTHAHCFGSIGPASTNAPP